MNIHENLESLVIEILNARHSKYVLFLHEEIKKNPNLILSCPSILTNPTIIHIHIWKDHIWFEYEWVETGAYSDNYSNIKVITHDYFDSNNSILEEIIGFKYWNEWIAIPFSSLTENLKYPTIQGMKKMLELWWNFDAESMDIFFWNSYPSLKQWENYRIINSTFFDEENNSLKTRHIKWLDLIALKSKEDDDKIEYWFTLPYTKQQAQIDVLYNYNLPIWFKYEKLKKLNNFVEFYWDNNNSETDITKFLLKEEHKFILTMNFGGQDIHSELSCEWQSEDKDTIRPDFFIVKPDGYCDIIEFKLPILKNKWSVWKKNRTTFSAEINSYISQTRVYREYFDDPNNRKWVKDKYDLKFYKPKRILVVGNRTDFPIDEWKEIKSDFTDLEIYTFDDIRDWTIVQLYRK